MKNELFGKKVLITGGTSGLGRELALQLASIGARVAIVARGRERLDETVQLNPKLIAIQGDVSKKEDVHPIAGRVHAELGEVDILIHAASELGQTPLRLLADTDCEDFERVLQTNLIGPFRLTKALLAGMLFKKGGLVVNISSDAAVNAYPRWGAYSVSKAALDHLTRIFDEELKAFGLRFLAIDPGDMRTPMHFAAVPDADPEKLRDPALAAERLIALLQTHDVSQIRRSL